MSAPIHAFDGIWLFTSRAEPGVMCLAFSAHPTQLSEIASCFHSEFYQQYLTSDVLGQLPLPVPVLHVFLGSQLDATHLAALNAFVTHNAAQVERAEIRLSIVQDHVIETVDALLLSPLRTFRTFKLRFRSPEVSDYVQVDFIRRGVGTDDIRLSSSLMHHHIEILTSRAYLELGLEILDSLANVTVAGNGQTKIVLRSRSFAESPILFRGVAPFDQRIIWLAYRSCFPDQKLHP
ncbi:hypothetical protein D9758_014267 [Tetrapyrgos nigripes]|uniref:Uncharacterized protein n=1 Tax=Tetrapyrgos nigripes TaxID=182062 RepID=A0A8H5CAN7_9AGAR|nr:hypothetical protein D9758_014267 [Tetrapyrgos nigripes]